MNVTAGLRTMSVLACVISMAVAGRADAAPMASFTASPPSPGCLGQSIVFDGSASTADPGRTLVEYRWQVDGLNVQLSPSPTFAHVFSSGGGHTVRLTAVDDLGSTGTQLQNYSLQTCPVIRYVKASATGANSGANWTDAYTSLQQALVDAVAGDEIWVAVGTYKPSAPGGRASTFQLRNNIAIVGGFRGQSGDEGIDDGFTRPGDPDPVTANPLADSVLSGDLNGNDGPGFANYGENTYHVVTGSGANATATINGFTIIGGNANGPNPTNDDDGGGVNSNVGSATYMNLNIVKNTAASDGGGFSDRSGNSTLLNCLLSGNTAGGTGGAMYIRSSATRIDSCRFASNMASHAGAIYGENAGSTAVIILRSEFVNNATSGNGGAIALVGSPTTLRAVSCRFHGNTAQFWGGVIRADFSTVAFTNCVMTGNSAVGVGEAIMLWNANGLISNCSIVTNTETTSGVIYLDTGAVVTIYNSILYSGAPFPPIAAQVAVASGGATVQYCNIQGGFAGTGNINVNPRFLDPDGPDNIGGNQDDDLRLAPFSRCIDAGRNGSVPTDAADLDGDANTSEPTPLDVDGNPRFADSSYICNTGVSGAGFSEFVDIGAYENNGAWATPGVIYVRSPSSGANNGASWADSYTSLTTALSAAGDLEGACPATPLQIWLAHCGCNPQYVPGASRSDTYNLINNVGIYGGFVGNETSLNQRLPGARTTISGEIGTFAELTDNSYHLFRAGPSINATARLDGVHVYGGYANGGGADDRGGGLLCEGSPVISNCGFETNAAFATGGAIHVEAGASPVVRKCSFSTNRTLASNGHGGAICSDSSTMKIGNCFFNANASSQGGGIHLAQGLGTAVYGCFFIGNTASGAGGAIYCAASTVTISNCTVIYNRSSSGGALYCIGSWNINNSIVWANFHFVGTQHFLGTTQVNGGTRTINNCCIQNFTAALANGGGTGNFTLDPRFADGNLPFGANNIMADGDEHGRLLSISPCIDRGNEKLLPADSADVDEDGDTSEPIPIDIAGNPRRYDVPDVADTGVGTAPLNDIGAYEFGSGDPYICIGGKCLGDLNHDGNVDGLDTQLFVNALLSGAPCP